MPTNHNGSPLEAALSFYSSIVTVNPEGDSLVSDETLEGLGTAGFLLQALFGSLFKIANPDLVTPPRRSPDAKSLSTSDSAPDSSQSLPYTDQIQSASANMASAAVGYSLSSSIPQQIMTGATVKRPILQYEGVEQSDTQPLSDLVEEDPESITTRLTDLLPEPGYFLAGAVSGGVSRTATAPLDRLKVYLLVSTKSTPEVAIAAAKNGRPLSALRSAGGPIIDAMASLWKAGGMRTFFAGKLCCCWACG